MDWAGISTEQEKFSLRNKVHLSRLKETKGFASSIRIRCSKGLIGGAVQISVPRIDLTTSLSLCHKFFNLCVIFNKRTVRRTRTYIRTLIAAGYISYFVVSVYWSAKGFSSAYKSFDYALIYHEKS